MADIAIFRINYKSDFILTLQSDAGWLTPFCIKFWTGAPSQAYFAGYDGTTYTHCAPVDGDPTKLSVQFDDHHLPIGDLKFQIGYHFTVADFPTSIEDEVINQAAVIIDNDGEQQQVMLDFNGETAPDIAFSLPAYANEAQRIANEQVRIAAEEQRVSNEQQRISNEEGRISAEERRQEHEQQRIHNEETRIAEFARLEADAIAATGAANDAATLANEKAQLASDKAALADAAATLANEKAQLAADKAALAQAAATLANEKAALAQQKAAYAQTQGDYAKAQGEIAEEDHERAEADHTRAESDHTQATSDHTQAGTDHSTAVNDHTQSVTDHTQADTDHTRAESDHTQAASDHTQAGADHTRAESDHTTASADHTHAGQDHTRAESDHTRAESDHAAVEVYVDSLGAFDISAYHATGGVLAKYADLAAALGTNGANIPDALRKGGMSVKFVQSSDNKYVQYRLMSDTFNTTPANWQGVDAEPTAGSSNLVKSGGVVKAINDEVFFNKISEGSVKSSEDPDTVSWKTVVLTDMPANKRYRVIITTDMSLNANVTVSLRKGSTDYEVIGYILSDKDVNYIVFSPLEDVDSLRLEITKPNNIGVTFTCALYEEYMSTVDKHIKDAVDIEEQRALEAEAGIEDEIEDINSIIIKSERKDIFSELSFLNAYVDKNTSAVISYNTYVTSKPFLVHKGDKVEVSCVGSSVYIISTTNSSTLNIGDTVNGKVVTTSNNQVRDYEYTAEGDEYIVICGSRSSVNAIYVTHSSSIDTEVGQLKSDVSSIELEVGSLDTRVTAIENHIQNADNNIDSDVLLIQKKIEDLGSYYFESSNATPVSYDEDDYLNNRIMQVPAGKHFIFITDTHISSSARKSTYLVDYVRKKLGINKVVFGGDSIDGYDTKYEAARYVREYANEFFSAFGKDGIWVQGNHDANAPKVISTGIDPSVGLIDNDIIYNSTVKNIENIVVFDTTGIGKLSSVFTSQELPMVTLWMKMHYYVDDVKDKIRYIVLETGDNSPAAMLFGNKALWLQLDFLASSLVGVPEDYSCVVLAHKVGWQSMSDDSTKYRPWFQYNDISAHLIEIISAYRNKTTVSIDCDDFPFRTEAALRAKEFFSLDGTTRTYDFSNVVGDGNVFLNSGHWHFDMAFVYMENGQWHSTGDEPVHKVEEIGGNPVTPDLTQTTGALLLWTNRDAYNLPGAYKTKGSDEVKRIVMANNTFTEHSFDVITIADNTLYCTRFGAGEDRQYRL